MKVKYLYIVCIVAAVVFSCAKPPIAEMESAREAVFRAENDEDAVLFAASTLARARDSLRRMQVDADSKRYDSAKTNAAEAIAAAEKAIADGKAGGGRAKEESEALLSSLRNEIEETSRNLNGARYSQLSLDYSGLNGELANARDYTDQAEAAHADGRYRDSLDSGRNARAVLGNINQKIAVAVPRSKQ
jgi:hypothetical protein